MIQSCRFISILVFLTVFLTIFSVIVIGNPIPVYPNPESVSIGLENIGSLNVLWVALVFMIDFCINIFIVYSGIYMLYYLGRITNEYIFDFSKKIFLVSLLIISIVGLFSELIFGTLFLGLLMALFTIFISYLIVAKYLFKFDWTNSFLLALFALFVNIIFWLVIFAI